MCWVVCSLNYGGQDEPPEETFQQRVERGEGVGRGKIWGKSPPSRGKSHGHTPKAAVCPAQSRTRESASVAGAGAGKPLQDLGVHLFAGSRVDCGQQAWREATSEAICCSPGQRQWTTVAADEPGRHEGIPDIL